MKIYKMIVNASLLDAADIRQLDPSLNKVKPGLANLAGNPSAVANYLIHDQYLTATEVDSNLLFRHCRNAIVECRPS